MIEYSNNMEFEKAAIYRDKISSIKKISEKQRAVSTKMDDKDIIVSVKDERDVLIIVYLLEKDFCW